MRNNLSIGGILLQFFEIGRRPLPATQECLWLHELHYDITTAGFGWMRLEFDAFGLPYSSSQ
jgi:hypothetical protein